MMWTAARGQAGISLRVTTTAAWGKGLKTTVTTTVVSWMAQKETAQKDIVPEERLSKEAVPEEATLDEAV